MAGKQSPSTPVSRPGEALDLSTSVAGEEDPGAAFDLPVAAPRAATKVCPECGGTGRLGASSCPGCQGTGKVAVASAGA
jgi:hypothetical protein